MTSPNSVAFGRKNPYDYIDEEKDYEGPDVRWLDTDEEAEVEGLDDPDQKIRATISDLVEFGIKIPSGGKLTAFDFSERRYLKPIYDTDAKRLLLKCGRQVEKTSDENANITMRDGSVKKLKTVEVGDEVIGLSSDGAHTDVGTVSWKSKCYNKPCVKITTRQGHEVIVALTHPMRTWDAWTESADLDVKDKLAVVRQAGEFVSRVSISDSWLILAANMVAEGSTCGTPSYSQNQGELLDDFLGCCQAVGVWWRLHERPTKGGLSWQLNFVQGENGEENPLKEKLQEWGIIDELSAVKHIPDFVFQLSQRQTALFLNRLWAGDGHASLQGSSYHLEYDSVSRQLCLGVQRLLWKFGIPTSMRRWKPNLYKGTDKWAYKLRVETQAGALRFIQDIGALGKTEALPLILADSNSNRDTFPDTIGDDIRQIHRSRVGYQARGRYVPQPSLRSIGLREKPKYPPSQSKLKEYVDFFRSDNRFDQVRVEALAAHLDTDLYWDEIVGIEILGDLPCYDITVDGTDSFIANGFITHNSTLLGNRMLAHMALIPFFRCLYVSPSNTQTKVFSKDRIKEPIDISPYLQSYTNSLLTQNILEKKFNNGSMITMRFAFLNADRCRGVPADMVNIDEIQDILLDNIPVIEECASHSEHKLFTYSGTPKSLDNAIEYYWTEYSTQNEWVVPCRRHGTPKNPGSWHWNILDEDNIGKKSLICDRCGKEIDPKDPDATWVAQNPKPRVEKPFEGYRIPQLMVPWIEWSDIMDKQRKYSRAKFNNEVLGQSYDSGTRPLTRNDLKKASWDKLSMQYYKEVKKYRATHPIFMGIDWGTGEGSFTVVTLGGYLPFAPERFTYFYMKRFEGVESDPERQLEQIIKLVNEFNVATIGVDYGGGFWPNDRLVRIFGSDKVMKYQWVGNVKRKIAFDPKLGVPRYLCHRTEVMSDMFNAIKRQNVFAFPRWEEFDDPFAKDFLNIFSEYNERLRMNVYKHAKGSPDDTFHSCLFGFLASFTHRTRPDVILPTKEVDRDHEEYDDLDIS